MNEFIHHILSSHISSNIQLKSASSIAGGCINSASQLITNQGSYFLKWNKEELNEMFATEEKGLAILNKESPVASPKVLGQGVFERKSYLLTELIEKGAPSQNFWKNFGANLANQHRKSSAMYGFDHDNFIGSLPQSNKKHSNWYDFFIEERLEPQLQLASVKNLIATDLHNQFNALFGKLSELIPSEPPALLHGDLWSGNFMINEAGEAAIFDPAVHYGHRETELAFTKLFGGFSSEFYDYYDESFPLESGFDSRVDIHNLYPLLVHVNLFGSSYLSGIISTLKRYA